LMELLCHILNIPRTLQLLSGRCHLEGGCFRLEPDNLNCKGYAYSNHAQQGSSQVQVLEQLNGPFSSFKELPSHPLTPA
jgi:hypothetical protein